MVKSKHTPGFSDEGSAFAGAAPEPEALRQTVELGAGGRLVIPAPMRQALGMKVGDRLTVEVDGDELRIRSYQAGIRRMQERMRQYLPENAVDGFLKWKRAEAAREEANFDRDATDE